MKLLFIIKYLLFVLFIKLMTILSNLISLKELLKYDNAMNLSH